MTTPIDKPYVNHNMGDHDNKVMQGSLFYVKRRFYKDMECGVIASMYLWDEKSKVYYPFGTTITSWLTAGEYEWNEAFTMPDDVPPGLYMLSMKTISHCGGHDYYTMAFEVPIEIVARP